MSDPTKPSYSTGNTGMSYSMNTTVQTKAPTQAAAAADGHGAAGAVIDVTTQSFMRDVIEASRTAPVIVDFWAPWCGPCKQLGPVIERLVEEFAASGRAITLAKMDVEQHPQVSQQMGIQSIPAVVAFVDGQPADAFMGAKPEGEVRAFLDKIAGPAPEKQDVEAMMEDAQKCLSAQDFEQAAALYSQVLQLEGGNLDAFAGLGQCYVAVGEIDMAAALMEKIPQEHHQSGPLAALAKTIALARQAGDLGEIDALAARVEAEPDNLDAKFDYAIALNAAHRRDEAAQQLVAIVKADREWRDDGGRTQLVEFFETWGNADPATQAGRRALSSVLFS